MLTSKSIEINCVFSFPVQSFYLARYPKSIIFNDVEDADSLGFVTELISLIYTRHLSVD